MPQKPFQDILALIEPFTAIAKKVRSKWYEELREQRTRDIETRNNKNMRLS
jgi:hypothetical protein